MTNERLKDLAQRALTILHLCSANPDTLDSVCQLMKRGEGGINETSAIAIENFSETETGDDIYDVEYGMYIYGNNVFASLLYVSDQDPSLKFFADDYRHIWIERHE